MSTEAQCAANKQNAQHSTGPKTDQGKAKASLNNLHHGFTGEFRLMAWERIYEYDSMLMALQSEHNPKTFTEFVLVERMAQHHWLRQRALAFQTRELESRGKLEKDVESSMALYIRYQTTNERAFHKCLNDLLKLRAEKRKAEIGSESQKRIEAEEGRRQADENRKQELHKFNVWLAEAKYEHQEVLTMNIETPETRIPNRIERTRARQQAA